MPGSTALVLGAHIGQWAALFLLKRFDVSEIILMDPDKRALERATATIARVAGEHYGSVRPVTQLKRRFFNTSSVVVSCAPHRFNRMYAIQAARAGVPYCDLGGHDATSVALRVYANEFSIKSPIVTDTGLSPGLVDICAEDFVQAGCSTIHTFCGGIPAERPDELLNPYVHACMFSPEGMAYEYLGPAFQICDGRIIQPPALDRIIEFSETLEAAPTANHPFFSVQHLLGKGVLRHVNWTLRYRGHYAAIQATPAFRAGEESLASLLKSEPLLRFDPVHGRDTVIMHILGSGPDTLAKEMHYELPFHEPWKAPAMGWTTGLGIALVAGELMQGRAPQGFSIPQEWFDPALALAALDEESLNAL